MTFTLAQMNKAIEIQSRMEVPLAQIFGRILNQQIPLTDVPTYIEIMHTLATCDAPDLTCNEVLMFLAEIVFPSVTSTVQ